jgi:hypothetical protein
MKYIDKKDLIIRESFSMAFKGGEIWFEQLDALSDHIDIVMDKFRRNLTTIKRPSLTGFIAINVNETLINEQMAEEIIRGFIEIPKIRKVVFIGVTKEIKKIIKQLLILDSTRVKFVYTFIEDYEKAKEWLVSK